jgi:hypothetical protein
VLIQLDTKMPSLTKIARGSVVAGPVVFHQTSNAGTPGDSDLGFPDTARFSALGFVDLPRTQVTEYDTPAGKQSFACGISELPLGCIIPGFDPAPKFGCPDTDETPVRADCTTAAGLNASEIVTVWKVANESFYKRTDDQSGPCDVPPLVAGGSVPQQVLASRVTNAQEDCSGQGVGVGITVAAVLAALQGVVGAAHRCRQRGQRGHEPAPVELEG